MKKVVAPIRVLSIDIGGTNIKVTILNSKGDLTMDYEKVPTPDPATPDAVIGAITGMVKNFSSFTHVSVGFPGYVKNGVVSTAPNLGTKYWAGVDLQQKLEKALDHPVKVVNDADMQGLGVVSGNGFEMVITLGTGFGTALLFNGMLLPHLEIAHFPYGKNKTYDVYIGERALEKEGLGKWNKRVKKVLKVLKTVFNYDTLYIGGGNARKLNFKLDKNIKLVTNEDGIKGGSRLWLTKENNKPEPETGKSTKK